MAGKKPFLLSHRTPQVLSAVLLVFTFVSIPLNIASIATSRRWAFRGIITNCVHNICLFYCLLELFSGIHFVFGRRVLDLGFETLQKWGAGAWGVLVLGYIYVVTDNGLRVDWEGHPTVVAALVFSCFQLTVLLIGLAIRTWRLVAEEGGRITLDDVPPPRTQDYGTTSGAAGMYVHVDPNGVNDEEERRRLL